jgi:hypothetical protein
MQNKLTLGICLLVCDGEFTAGGGGLDGGAGRGGGCPNLVPRSGPSAILAGMPKISSSGLLTSNHTRKNFILTSEMIQPQNNINNQKQSCLGRMQLLIYSNLLSFPYTCFASSTYAKNTLKENHVYSSTSLGLFSIISVYVKLD